jgi:hypothetical protein
MAKIQTLVKNRRLLLDWDWIKGFISEHIHGLIRMYNVGGLNDESA